MTGLNLSFKGLGMSYAHSDTVTILARNQTGTSPLGSPIFGAPTTVYNGPASFQQEAGQIAYDMAGTVRMADAICFIDPDSSGNMPAVIEGHKITWAGEDYMVERVVTYTSLLPHLEVYLKAGGVW